MDVGCGQSLAWHHTSAPAHETGGLHLATRVELDARIVHRCGGRLKGRRRVADSVCKRLPLLLVQRYPKPVFDLGTKDDVVVCGSEKKLDSSRAVLVKDLVEIRVGQRAHVHVAVQEASMKLRKRRRRARDIRLPRLSAGLIGRRTFLVRLCSTGRPRGSKVCLSGRLPLLVRLRRAQGLHPRAQCTLLGIPLLVRLPRTRSCDPLLPRRGLALAHGHAGGGKQGVKSRNFADQDGERLELVAAPTGRELQ